MAPQENFSAPGVCCKLAPCSTRAPCSAIAHRSIAIERTPGYGRFVINDYGLTEGDLLIIANAYGINAATIDAALEVRRRGVEIIGVTSVRHASETSKDRVARHLSKQDLHELVDVVLDSRCV